MDLGNDVKPLLVWWSAALMIIAAVVLYTYRSGPAERLVAVLLGLAGVLLLWLNRRGAGSSK